MNARFPENLPLAVPSLFASRVSMTVRPVRSPRPDPAADPPLGYFDGPLGGYLISDAGDVASMVNMFDDLARPALDPAASEEMIAAILEDYRRKGGGHA
jgi:hypothetical protein